MLIYIRTLLFFFFNVFSKGTFGNREDSSGSLVMVEFVGILSWVEDSSGNMNCMKNLNSMFGNRTNILEENY